ncbi:MAG: hypothetical protein QGH33_02140 [Pirellulaceae bacterium]|jgi:signal transduction histidine kinase|nr:hypothetical protein [Pirellulaceae bacterium]
MSYWLLGLATYVTVILVYRIAPYWLVGSDDQLLAAIWRDLCPFIIVSVAISPIVLISVIRFSNRFIGPMLRFRRAIKQLAKGETPARIALRRQDYWRDMADDINQVSVLLENTRSVDHDEPPRDVEELVEVG